MIRQQKCVIYMDDIVFIGTTKEELQRHTIEGIKILDKANLYVKDSKCYWEVEEVPILGHIVGSGQSRMEPVKLDTIRNWKTPKNKKEVQTFNGFCNFYQRYIKDYSLIAKPITKLMGDHPWEWGPDQDKAFKAMKAEVLRNRGISLPRLKGQCRVEVDASGFALGGVLSQFQDGNWRTVAFISRVMSSAELNYDIYDKELLAIMYAIEKWRPYLLDSYETFEIWTDHKNLTYFRKPQCLNSRQARWYLTLQEYDFSLHHIPGKQNNKVDILSRLPWYENQLPDQKDMQLLPEKKFTKKVMFRTDSPVLLFVEEQFSEGGETIKSSKKRHKSKRRKRRLKPVHVKSDLETQLKKAMTTDKLDDSEK
jgi:hypothetical protein